MKFDSFIEHIHPITLSSRRIRVASTFCLGGSTFFLFIVLAITGLLLTIYYLPTAEGARVGLHDLDHVIPFGRTVRSIHFWAGQMMVVGILLHTMRVVMSRAHLPPRHINWLIGICLMALTLALDFSGYVLRWNSESYWAAQVMFHLLGKLPVAGRGLQQLVFGAPKLTESGLLRFYVIHCFAAPVMTMVLIMYHFWRVRKDGKLKRAL